MRTCYVHVCAFIWVLYVLLATVIAVWKGLVTLDKAKEIQKFCCVSCTIITGLIISGRLCFTNMQGHIFQNKHWHSTLVTLISIAEGVDTIK